MRACIHDVSNSINGIHDIISSETKKQIRTKTSNDVVIPSLSEVSVTEDLIVAATTSDGAIIGSTVHCVGAGRVGECVVAFVAQQQVVASTAIDVVDAELAEDLVAAIVAVERVIFGETKDDAIVRLTIMNQRRSIQELNGLTIYESPR